MATDVKSVLETLGGMTVLELVELKKAIEEEWGVTAAAPVAMAAPGMVAAGGDGGAAAAEEKDSFDVVLTGRGMEEERVDRQLAAILSGDIVGYSRLMGVDEEGTLRQLKVHRRELVDPKIAVHRGRIVKTTGDGMLVEFASVVDAVRCAVHIQRAMAERTADLPEEKRIRFRIGINVGDIISDENDIFGDGVNVAARLQTLAEAGGIYVSRAVHDQVRDKLGIGFVDMGEQPDKNIARPVRVFRNDTGVRGKAASSASDPEAVFRQPGVGFTLRALTMRES